jgi:hypothetical protein
MALERKELLEEIGKLDLEMKELAKTIESLDAQLKRAYEDFNAKAGAIQQCNIFLSRIPPDLKGQLEKITGQKIESFEEVSAEELKGGSKA